MRRILIIITLSISVTNSLFGQTNIFDDNGEIKECIEINRSGIATGVHINKYPMVEVGYFNYTTYDFPITYGWSSTVETYFIEDLIIAPKLNFWRSILFVNIGASIPWYFNFNGQNSLKIRPEIGFGYDHFKINYSRNISITNKEMEKIGTHFISLNYYIGLKDK